MTKLRVLDLFSGIGGFSLGLERTGGFETVAFCELEPYCRRVLAKHWPTVPVHDDVTRLDGEQYRGAVDLVCGGFPCTDISIAGSQAGIDGAQSGLWGQFARIIGEVRPRLVLVENVPALLSGDSGRWFGRVLGDLATLGFDAAWHCIPASAVSAPHQRDRVWVIAYASGDRVRVEPERHQRQGRPVRASERRHPELEYDGATGSVAHSDGGRRQGERVEEHDEQQSECGNLADRCGTGRWRHGALAQFINEQLRECAWEVEPDVGRVADGVPDRSHRLKALGNAVVPQIVEVIGRAIMEAER